MNHRIAVLSVCIVTIASASASALGQTYTFTVDPTNSLWKSNAQTSEVLKGSITGNYSATNTSGTRTKPGLSGAFNSTENDPVPVKGTVSFASSLDTSLTGSFSLAVNLKSNSVVLSNLSISSGKNVASSSKLDLSLNTQAFQTKNPTFAYPALAKTLSVGSIKFDSFSVSETGTGKGRLKLISGETYEFAAIYIAEVSATVSTGSATQAFTGKVPLLFTGKLTIATSGATLVSTFGRGGTTWTLPGNVLLPSFSFGLPALDGTANLIGDLAMTSATIEFARSGNLIANGTASK